MVTVMKGNVNYINFCTTITHDPCFSYNHSRALTALYDNTRLWSAVLIAQGGA
jgi:hypothetical protein